MTRARRLLLIALAWLIAGLHPAIHTERAQWRNVQHLEATALAGMPRHIGPLRLLEAWELTSDNLRASGISAMALTGPRRFLMLTDAGMVMRFGLSEAGAVSGVAITPLPIVRGSIKNSGDAESLWRDPVDGLWVGFEGSHRIIRTDPDLARPLASVRPRQMRGWAGNGGLEAMTRLPDGRFLALSERSRTRCCGEAGVLFGGDPTARPHRDGIAFGYRSWGMGLLTDAATLPDGRVLLLHRRVTPPLQFASTLSIGDPAEIAHAQSWTSRPLAAIIDGPLTENYEALAIETRADGIGIWMASDDNFSSLQRTLLLHLLLPWEALPPR